MPSLPSASIVLCTCEGERFLPTQLESLRAQTVQAEEVIVQDDASTDGTMAILSREPEGGLPLSICRNSARLGFAQNFAAAIARAKGSVIFLCDQDDFWEPQKVETLLRQFAANPQLALAFSEANYMDEQGLALPGNVLAGNGLTAGEAVAWEKGGAFAFLVRRNPVPGMLMAFRASLREELLLIPQGWEHDYWILLMLAGLEKTIAIEPSSLARYRQHQGQAIGGQKGLAARWQRASRQTLANLILESGKWEALRDRLDHWHASERNLALIAGKCGHAARRGRYSGSRILRAMEIAAELAKGNYHKFEAGFSSAAKDWLRPS